MKTPSSTVFSITDLRPEKAWKIKTQIQKTIVKDLISKHSYNNTITPQLQQYLDCPDNSRWNTKKVPTHILTCHFDRKKMIQSDITIEEIVCGVRKIGKAVTVAYYDNLLEEIQMFVRIKDNNKFFKYVKMIMDTTIKGSKHIEKVNIRSEGERFIVETEGIDLMHLKTLQSIDQNRTQCNDIFAILKTFGIEAARAVLLKEMHQVLAAYGIYVNHRHLMVIIDWMTWTGNINALTRHGVKKMMDDSTPLKRATFEQPVEIFHRAAVKGLKDTLSGVSEQLLIGNAPKIGSYYNDVVTDQDYQKIWDNDNWKPPEEIVEDNLFGDWTGAASEWDSHQTYATNENKVDENKAAVLREQQDSAWRNLQNQAPVQQQACLQPVPAWQQNQAPVQQQAWLQQQSLPAWQQNQAPVQQQAWLQQQSLPAWQQNQAPVQQQAWQTNQAPSQYVPISPNYCPKSPDYGPSNSPPSKKQKIYSPVNSGPQSPTYGPSESPPSKKQKIYSPTMNNISYSPCSPQYTPKNKQEIYSPTMNNNSYSPCSPQYTPKKKKQKLYSPTNNKT